MRNSSVISGITFALTALMGLGCAHMPQLLAPFRTEPIVLKARGPGTVFGSIDTAAVDALTYAYLQAQASHDTDRTHGGTIYKVGTGYSYGEIHVASNLETQEIAYPLKRQDVARFHMYPLTSGHEAERVNEWASRADRRSVAVVDPLHRPLFVLHPSLLIREYHGNGDEVVAVADLRSPKRVILLAEE